MGQSKAVFRFDDETKEMYLCSVYLGVSAEEAKREVGWHLKIAQNVKAVEPPTTEKVKFIRSYDPHGYDIAQERFVRQC